MVPMVPDNLMVFTGNANPKLAQAVADHLGISQSYISRLEKKIIARLKVELDKNKNKFDAISSNSLDSLIRSRLITDAMATSIMNDNALSRSIAKNLRHAADIITKSQEIDA